MTEVEKTAPTVLEIAIAKQSVSAIAVALVNQNGRETTLQEIVDVCAANGVQSDPKKIYASVQTLATHGKIARGITKGTYAPAGTVDQAARAEAKAAAKPAKAERQPRAGKEPARTYTNEEVFTDLIAQFGEPREFVVGESWGPTHVLLGDASAAHMVERATVALGAAPTAWTLTSIGPNSAVMFLG